MGIHCKQIVAAHSFHFCVDSLHESMTLCDVCTLSEYMYCFTQQHVIQTYTSQHTTIHIITTKQNRAKIGFPFSLRTSVHIRRRRSLTHLEYSIAERRGGDCFDCVDINNSMLSSCSACVRVRTSSLHPITAR